MTVIFRDVLGTVQLEGVKHFQVLDDTTYFDFLMARKPSKKILKLSKFWLDKLKEM